MSHPAQGTERSEGARNEAHHEDGPVPKFLYLVYAGIAAFFAYYVIVHWRG